MNGRRSWVEDVPDAADHYRVGAIVLGTWGEESRRETSGTLREAQHVADTMSDCAQPCRCPRWEAIPRRILK